MGDRIVGTAAEQAMTGESLGRVGAAKELLRLERRIERAEQVLTVLRIHRERLLGLIGQP